MRGLRSLVPAPILDALRSWKRARERERDAIAFERFFASLILRTRNFSTLTWLGKPIWQNTLDLWTIQETVFEVSPALLIETGTHRGGSAYFYACLFDLMKRGEVLTIDVRKMHDLSHPRIEFLLGSSTSESVVVTARARAAATRGPVMVILDSDHTESHVFQEMEVYGPLVTPGSFLLVQDGSIDTLALLRADRPGPLPAIKRFLARHPEFEVDAERGERFLITHHPMGWLRRTR